MVNFCFDSYEPSGLVSRDSTDPLLKNTTIRVECSREFKRNVFHYSARYAKNDDSTCE
jgi:hypothetical protein